MTGDTYCFVVNPASCHGRGIRRMPAVLGPLSAAGDIIRIEECSSLGHAAALATEAVERGEIVVAVGGDGTVGRMAAAVAAADGVLGIIPAGRGNDFARMLGIPTDPARAAAVLLRGGHREVDLIGVRAGDGPEQVVAGSVYLGIPSEGARIAAASRLPPGGLAYQIAGLRALLAWQPASFTVSKENGTAGGTFGGFCVVVANSAYFAAGTPAAPDADVTDGLLDVVTVSDGSKLSFVRVMLLARRGRHTRLAQVGITRAARVTVSADRAMLAGADGEPLPFASPLATGVPLGIRALRGVLRVAGRVPEPAASQSG
ncbi:MAG TPA: YegS/Rv2252/BmrU family lipid kinase [Streptosporangiaceae bacterium]|nr:YegS/Rv2252/BmrU family lipid kinase [Streptosporangiaceae bacterium]